MVKTLSTMNSQPGSNQKRPLDSKAKKPLMIP